MNTIRTKIAAFIFGVSLIILLILASVFNVGLSNKVYKEIQVELQIAEYAMCSQETLDFATNELIDYIEDKRDNLDMRGVINNIESPIFNEREIAHMIDVKNLFSTGRVLLISLGLFIILIFIFELISNREAFNYKFFKSVTITMIAVLGAFLLIAAYALFDFNSFWMSFHKIFFTNDLFLLNPETDFLIRMMPLQFFISIVFKIGIRFIIGFGISICIMITTHLILKGSKSK